MCGIIGYVGKRDAVEVLIDGLQKLEYRGYDSAGIIVLGDRGFICEKSPGKIANLLSAIERKKLSGTIGLGHTRWATHGEPSWLNAHPHLSCRKTIAIVHNGIIENSMKLKKSLSSKGHKFVSQTDTEVIVHLIEDFYNGNPFSAIQNAVRKLEGSFALGIIFNKHPGLIVAVRKDSPLVIGLGNEEKFIASDVPAIISYTRDVIYLDNGQIGMVTKNDVRVFTFEGHKKAVRVSKIDWNEETCERGGFSHFMLKEIMEEPEVARNELIDRIELKNGDCNFNETKIDAKFITTISRIIISACGTAYHSGIVGKYAIEELTKIPADVGFSSEIRYSNMHIDKNTLFIGISQSGETADTLAALNLAKRKGAKTLAITNIKGSTISREANWTLYMRSGLEIGVAATKTYISQLICITLLAIKLGRLKGTLSKDKAKLLLSDLVKIPDRLRNIVENADKIKNCARIYKENYDFMYIGRRYNIATAYEGALKLKEISYLHAEGYGGGEMKHGPLALVDEKLVTIAIALKSPIYEKMLSNIQEIKARKGKVIAVACDRDKILGSICDHTFYIPESLEITSPILAIVPLQLFAYYVAVELGRDVDKPRNLAKSVTVE